MDTVDGAALHMPTIVQANRYEGGGGLGNSGDDYDMATGVFLCPCYAIFVWNPPIDNLGLAAMSFLF